MDSLWSFLGWASAGGMSSEGLPSGGASSEGLPSGGASSEGLPSGGSPSEGLPSGGAPSAGAPSEGEIEATTIRVPDRTQIWHSLPILPFVYQPDQVVLWMCLHHNFLYGSLITDLDRQVLVYLWNTHRTQSLYQTSRDPVTGFKPPKMTWSKIEQASQFFTDEADLQAFARLTNNPRRFLYKGFCTCSLLDLWYGFADTQPDGGAFLHALFESVKTHHVTWYGDRTFYVMSEITSV